MRLTAADARLPAPAHARHTPNAPNARPADAGGEHGSYLGIMETVKLGASLRRVSLCYTPPGPFESLVTHESLDTELFGSTYLALGGTPIVETIRSLLFDRTGIPAVETLALHLINYTGDMHENTAHRVEYVAPIRNLPVEVTVPDGRAVLPVRRLIAGGELPFVVQDGQGKHSPGPAPAPPRRYQVARFSVPDVGVSETLLVGLGAAGR